MVVQPVSPAMPVAADVDGGAQSGYLLSEDIPLAHAACEKVTLMVIFRGVE